MNPDNSSNRHRQDAIGTPQVMKDGAEREGEREREREEREIVSVQKCQSSDSSRDRRRRRSEDGRTRLPEGMKRSQ